MQFAQLLPGLETGHPVTVGQSPAYSVSDEQKAVFLVSVSDVDCSVCDCHVQVTDRLSPNAPSLTQAIILLCKWTIGDHPLPW